MTKAKPDRAESPLKGPMLAEVDEESRRALNAATTPADSRAGTVLFAEGEPNDHLWFVAEGTVAIERAGPDGHPEVLATMAGPSLFGTSTFFRGSTPRATVRATTDLVARTLDRLAYGALRRDDPRAAEALAVAALRTLSDRFDGLIDRLAAIESGHDDRPRSNEWNNFRARLFEEPVP